MYRLWLVFMLLLTGCAGIPEGIQPVKPFVLENYLGRWYEIARLDNRFERGLSQITANYALAEDGSVRVINRGYSQQDQLWHEAEGKAYFVDDSNQGYLKVSFFGPFYGSYVIFELDQNYQYAMISGSDKSYLWILARSPQISEELQARLIAKANSLGFDTKQLIFVEHTQSER